MSLPSKLRDHITERGPASMGADSSKSIKEMAASNRKVNRDLPEETQIPFLDSKKITGIEKEVFII